MLDEDVRTSCFAQLAMLCAAFGEDVPYRGGLDRGIAFRGQRVPYLSPQKGIYRARVQRGPAALSIQTSANTPYRDVETPDGFLYDYPAEHRVLVAPGAMVGPVDEPEPVLPEDPIERRYFLRQTRVRIHQARFRGRVLPAYRVQCAMCRLKEIRLLEAAHIVSDVEEAGEPIVSNGLSLCSIHHRAFDHDLVAVSPDYDVRVSPRLLDDEDGPMLELLKGFDGKPIHVPRRSEWKPDRDRLAARYERFLARTS